jgi:hypothetical protein
MQCAVMYFPCNIQNGIVFHVGNKIGREVISPSTQMQVLLPHLFLRSIVNDGLSELRSLADLFVCVCVCVYKFK